MVHLFKGVGNPTNRTIRRDEGFGPVIVVGARTKREGLWVYRCQCLCGQANCPGLADLDERLLLTPQPFWNEKCFFEAQATVVSFAELQASLQRLHIMGEEEYDRAYANGILPKGSPRDPAAVYPEWKSWANVTGQPDFISPRELSRRLVGFDADSFYLMPELERYRFLVSQRLLFAVERRAKQLNVTVAEVMADLTLLIDKSDRAERVASTLDDNAGAKVGKPRELKVIDLTALHHSLGWVFEHCRTLGDGVLPVALNGWKHELWNAMDRRDAFHGDGFEQLDREVLTPLENKASGLVQEFREEYHAVKKFKTGKRNWMQAYALWYGIENRRWINYSDPGVGKTRTVSALVAHENIKVTVFIAPLKLIARTNPQFPNEVKAEDSKAIIHHVEDPLPTKLVPGYHHYILLHPHRFELGERSRAMVDQLLSLGIELLVIDEAQLVASKNDDQVEDLLKPRTLELQRLVQGLGKQARIGLMTGTPVRTHVSEGKFMFTLLGIDCSEIPDGQLSYVAALNLRAKFQEHGFRFVNHKLPVLEQYVIPFKVPSRVAEQLNQGGNEYLQNESVRIQYALRAITHAIGREVFRLTDTGLEKVLLPIEPLDEAVNPVFFTMFVDGDDGPTASIRNFLKKRGLHFYECFGGTNEFDQFVARKDGALIASAAFGIGLDGAHKTSNTLITLGMPWHYAGHKQLTARLQRQNASLGGKPTKVIREFIPIATNVVYDVQRFQRVYDRREFSDCLLDGKIAPSVKRPEAELKTAFQSTLAHYALDSV